MTNSESGLKHKTVNALKWSYLSLALTVTLGPLFTALLARLLTREQFGVYAIGLSLYALGQFLADFGIGQALVQKSELTEEDIRAGFTSSVVLGLLMTVIAWAAAPLAGHFYHNPAVVPMFRGFACLYVLATLTTVSMSLLRRTLKFKPIMVAEVSAFVIGQGVFGLGAAYLGFGAFSLVISVAAQFSIQLIVTYLSARHPFRFTFNPASYRALYAFGSRASLANFLEFVSANLDTFLVGRLYNVTTLGVYSRAYNAVSAPMLKLGGGLTRVLTPSFSAVQREQPKLRRAYLSGLLVLCMVLFSIAAAVFVSAREIVLVLLGAKFAAAIPIVQVFALFVPFQIIPNLSGALAEATARLHFKIGIQLGYLILLAAAFWLVHDLGWSIVAFAGARTVMGVLRAAVYSLAAYRIIGGGGRDMLRAYGVGLLYAGLVAAGMAAVVRPLRAAGTSPFALFALELALGGALLALGLLLGPPNELQPLIRKALRAVAGRTRRARKTT